MVEVVRTTAGFGWVAVKRASQLAWLQASHHQLICGSIFRYSAKPLMF